VCGGQELSVLNHHFGAVNIGMVDGCLLRTFVQVENVHRSFTVVGAKGPI